VTEVLASGSEFEPGSSDDEMLSQMTFSHSSESAPLLDVIDDGIVGGSSTTGDPSTQSNNSDSDESIYIKDYEKDPWRSLTEEGYGDLMEKTHLTFQKHHWAVRKAVCRLTIH
jgi:hypothetical protein